MVEMAFLSATSGPVLLVTLKKYMLTFYILVIYIWNRNIVDKTNLLDISSIRRQTRTGGDEAFMLTNIT